MSVFGLGLSRISRGKVVALLTALPVAYACSDAVDPGPIGPSTGGFQTNTGGAPGLGGAISTSGMPGSGGSPTNTSGSPGAGGSTGGTQSTGGVQNTGGAASGGLSNSGGSATTQGGANSNGGSTTSSGATNGGSNGNGGSKSTGGTATAGGGSKSTGGTATAGGGSKSTGGTATAGGGSKSTGGTAGGGNSAGTNAGGSGGGATGDPNTILGTFRPTNSDLRDLFDGYVKTIGTLTNGTVGTGTARTITQVIFVAPNVVYDGKGEKLTAKGMGDGSQDEGQKPLFLLAPGASLKNVTITAPGCEGVHMMGNNTVENVVWEDVGEDAASVRSYFPGGKITITGGSAKSAEDKTFQFNVSCDVTIKNFKASNVGKLVRQNGGKDFPLTITLDTVNVTNVKDAVVMSDSAQCTVRYHALTTDASTTFDGPMKTQAF